MASSAVREQLEEIAGSGPMPDTEARPMEWGPQPKRVLFLDHTAAISGGEIALSNLLHHLDPGKVKAIVVLGADGPLIKRLPTSVDLHVLPLDPAIAKQKKDSLGPRSLLRIKDIWYLAKYVFRLKRFIQEHKIEVVHTNSLKADIIGGLAGRLAFRRVVWHVRDRIEDDYLPAPVVHVFRFLSHLIPHYVIANSAATLRTLRLPFDARATSIPSGVDINGKAFIVHDGTAPLPHNEKAQSDSFRIGLIGRISPWKGQHIFIRAAALVHKRFPRARFLIIGAALFGEEQYDREVRELPRKLQIDEVVEFTGFRNDVNGAIADLDMVVHASTKGEPFGQVIIEGMAAGKPVVATDGGGVPEIVEDGKTGILVPMGDVQAMAEAMCKILAAPEKAKEMGARGRERVVALFTSEQTARRVEAVYEEMFRE